MNTTLLIATSNPGKVKELAALLAELPCQVIGLTDLPTPPAVPEETGATFAENALLKADYYHAQTGLLTLADDSGLAVDALNGAPGVYSARYGGEGLTSGEQIQLLLQELRDVPTELRTARFVCCIALTGKLSGVSVRETFEANYEGVITNEPRGNNGFGYDPVFLDTILGRTLAELSQAEKAARSHRGQALRAALQFLSQHFPPQQS